MKPEILFNIVNMTAPLGWLLLIFAPRWRWTQRIVLSLGIILVFSVIYVTMFFMNVAAFKPDSFNSLAGVMALFKTPEAVVIGWVHYLTFDMFVGCWEVSNAQKAGVPHGWVIPCLIFTFMLGPTGLLLYFIIRHFMRKNKLESNF